MFGRVGQQVADDLDDAPPSAITRGRYVLFANEGNVESTPERPIGNDPWLKLVEVNHRVVDG